MVHIIKQQSNKFNNKNAALWAFLSCQCYFIQKGFLTTSQVDINSYIRLTVYFEPSTPPTVPEGYKYSQKEIFSYPYFSDLEKRNMQMRFIILTFEYK